MAKDSIGTEIKKDSKDNKADDTVPQTPPTTATNVPTEAKVTNPIMGAVVTGIIHDLLVEIEDRVPAFERFSAEALEKLAKRLRTLADKASPLPQAEAEASQPKPTSVKEAVAQIESTRLSSTEKATQDLPKTEQVKV